MLEVGNGGMTKEQYRSHFSVWALMKVYLIKCKQKLDAGFTNNQFMVPEAIKIQSKDECN
jgi:hypothetical protein